MNESVKFTLIPNKGMTVNFLVKKGEENRHKIS